MSDPILHAEHLTKIFGSGHTAVRAVDDVSLDVARGELVAIMGPSGSGKTTLVSMLGALLRPSSGTIAIDGVDITTLDEAGLSRLRAQKIGFIFQTFNLLEVLSVEDNVLFPAHLAPGGMRAARPRCSALLERLNLTHRRAALPRTLSGGEKQRVAIARAFAAEPEVVLCDEITSALDVSVQAAVLNLLDALRAQAGVTYVFVSHDLAVVRALADRVAVLYQGRLCEIGPASEVYTLPSHPYTEVLLGAVLEPDPDVSPVLAAEDVVERSPPAKGCPFQRRCPRKLGNICDTQTPPWQSTGDAHAIRCHIPLDELKSMQQGNAAETSRVSSFLKTVSDVQRSEA